MQKLVSCAHCNGFLTPTDPACPHCERPAPAPATATATMTATTNPAMKTGAGWLVGGLVALCGGAFAVTLMACYGLPPCGPNPDCEPPDLKPAPTDMLSCVDGGADAGCAQRDGG